MLQQYFYRFILNKCSSPPIFPLPRQSRSLARIFNPLRLVYRSPDRRAKVISASLFIVPSFISPYVSPTAPTSYPPPPDNQSQPPSHSSILPSSASPPAVEFPSVQRALPVPFLLQQYVPKGKSSTPAVGVSGASGFLFSMHLKTQLLN